MNRWTSTVSVAICWLTIALSISVCAQEVKLSAAQPKITTASAVRARIGPQVAAEEITRLKLGTVVSAVARTTDDSEIGGKKDYWYRVNLLGAQSGWIFGGLLRDYSAARQEEIFREIIGERLKAESMSFDDGIDLYNFASNAVGQTKSPNVKGEFELLKLLALSRSLNGIPFEKRERAPYRDWLKAHQQEIVYSEPSGDWLVRSELFWNLERTYHRAPIAERIAWEAAQNPLPGECESDEVCQFLYVNVTDGQYLRLHPNGAHAGEALKNLQEALASAELASTLKSKSRDKYAVMQREDLIKALAELRTTLSKPSSPEKSALLKQLNQLLSGIR
jgi:hypothetical protein